MSSSVGWRKRALAHCPSIGHNGALRHYRLRDNRPPDTKVTPMKIVLCYPVQQHHIDQIASAMPGADVVDAGQENIAQELFNADIYCGHAKVPVDWRGVVEQGRLRWIQSSAAGMDHCLVPPVIESDIEVTSASAVLSDQVAEHTIGLLTAWNRNQLDERQVIQYNEVTSSPATRCPVDPG